jgi:predicted regulator of Ras-like GTPase activity (Roadblock/LC7/MglB family)
MVGVYAFPMESPLPGTVEERRVSAVAAAMSSMGELTHRQIRHFWTMACQVSVSSLMARLVSCLW